MAENENLTSTEKRGFFGEIGHILKEELSPKNDVIGRMIKENQKLGFDALFKKIRNAFKQEFKPETDAWNTIGNTWLEATLYERARLPKINKSAENNLSKEDKKALENQRKVVLGRTKYSEGKARSNAGKSLLKSGEKTLQYADNLLKSGIKNIFRGLLKGLRIIIDIIAAILTIIFGIIKIAFGVLIFCTLIGIKAGKRKISNGVSTIGQGFGIIFKMVAKIILGIIQAIWGMVQIVRGICSSAAGVIMKTIAQILSGKGQKLQKKGVEMMQAGGQNIEAPKAEPAPSKQPSETNNTETQEASSVKPEEASKTPESTSDTTGEDNNAIANSEKSISPENKSNNEPPQEEEKASVTEEIPVEEPNKEPTLSDMAQDVAMMLGSGAFMNQLMQKNNENNDKNAEEQIVSDNTEVSADFISAKKWDAIYRKRDMVKMRYDALKQSGLGYRAVEELSRFEKQLRSRGNKGDFGLSEEQVAAFKLENKDKFVEWRPKEETPVETDTQAIKDDYNQNITDDQGSSE